MDFKHIFGKLGKRKKSESKSHENELGKDTPRPETRTRGGIPKLETPAAFSASESPPSVAFPTSTSSEPMGPEIAGGNKNTWTNLGAFLNIINRATVYAPLATAIDDLMWFVKMHESVATARIEYQELRTQLEALFEDLGGYFSGSQSPAMTTSMLNLCKAIQAELKELYGTQDRNKISQYVQAENDLDKITGYYRRIQGHLQRVMFNASMNMWKILDKQGAEAQLDRLTPSMAACYDSRAADVVQRRECTPNTRQQVLQDLKAWKDNPRSEKVCWINGMAGTGKTTITNTLCSSLDATHQLGASFFCTRLIPACRDVELILPTIAYQLARFSSPFRGELLQVLDRDPDVHTKVLRVQFRRMILEPLRGVMCSLPSNIVVVVDALDECDDSDGVKQILEVLLEHASELPIKFLVSSRPEYHIREKIRKSTLKTQLILHELDEKLVNADIETYLRAEMESASISLTQPQLATLAERAGTLFIYAATVVRYIKHGDTAERLDAVLKSPGAGCESTNKSKEIDRLYETVLVSAFDNEELEQPEKERMQLVLHTVVCAQEPLTIDALAGLLSLAPTQIIDALKPLWSVLHVPESDASHPVSTLHASFSDYIFDSKRSRLFACNTSVHNGRLSELCFQRIERHRPQFNVCNLLSSYVFDEDVPDIDEKVKQAIPMDLLYACQYWATHLEIGEISTERVELLFKFLAKRLLMWMEVLNLTKRIHRSIGAIGKAIDRIQAINSSEHVLLIARDAQRFVTMFATSPVSRSTPHLYISMLASWPDDQPISDCYSRKATNFVKIKGIETAKRQLALLSSISVGTEIKCVAYAPDGTSFAAGTVEGTILIWDTLRCRMDIDPIRGHDGVVQTIAFSPDGMQICSGSYDHTLCIWNPRTGHLIAGPLKEHSSWVLSVDYSPNGQWLISGSYDGTLRLWSTRDWKTKGRPYEGQDGRMFPVVFSPKGSFIAASSKSLIHLWDPTSNRLVCEPLNGHTNYINALAFLPDERYLVSGSEDCSICVWDVSSGQIAFGPFREHVSGIDHVAVSPNGSLVISASQDNTMRIWDTQTWHILSVFQQTGIVKSVRFSPDGSRLISGSLDGNIRIWNISDTALGRVVDDQLRGHSGWVRCAVFSPCGNYIISGSSDTTVRVWDAQDGRPISLPANSHNDRILSVVVSADGNHIFSISADRMACVWGRKSGQLEYTIGPIETDGNYDALYYEDWPAAFSFSGGRMACGSKSGRIYMWEGSTLSFEAAGHTEPVTAIAFSPHGRSFFSGSESGELILWDGSTGKQMLGPFLGHSDCVNSISLSPDGFKMASGSLDTTIRLWSIDTGLPACDPFEGHTRSVRSVAFSPCGTYIVSGSDDMSVRVWDVVKRESIAIIKAHTHSVLTVGFSPDGTQIVSGSADMTIRLWNAPLAKGSSVSYSDIDYPRKSVAVVEHNPYLGWMMDKDGWLHDDQHCPLFWVPPDLRSILLWPQNKILISSQGCIELDFSEAQLGETWETCYRSL